MERNVGPEAIKLMAFNLFYLRRSILGCVHFYQLPKWPKPTVCRSELGNIGFWGSISISIYIDIEISFRININIWFKPFSISSSISIYIDIENCFKININIYPRSYSISIPISIYIDIEIICKVNINIVTKSTLNINTNFNIY